MAINLTKVGGLVDIQGLSGGIEYIVDSSSTRPSIKLFGTNNVLVLSTSLGVISIPFAAVTDFQIAGVAVTDLADFKTKIATVFPNEGGGSGSTPTLDAVLAVVPATLTEDRTVDTGGYFLKVQESGETLLEVNPSTGSSRLKQFNDTGNGNEGEVSVKANTTQAEFSIGADFNDSVKSAYIEGKSNVSEAEIYYIAEVHEFTGNVSMNQILNLAVFTNSSPTDGDIWREDNTNTGLKVRINGVTKTITVS